MFCNKYKISNASFVKVDFITWTIILYDYFLTCFYIYDLKTSKLIAMNLFDRKTESDDCFGHDFPEGIQRQGGIVWRAKTNNAAVVTR